MIGRKTVASITRNLVSMADQLDRHRAAENARVGEIESRIERLNDERDEAEAEAKRAEGVAAKIRNLLD